MLTERRKKKRKRKEEKKKKEKEKKRQGERVSGEEEERERKSERGGVERSEGRSFLSLYTREPRCAVRIRGKLVFRNFYESVEKKL